MKNSYIGYSSNPNVRHDATSGGIGSALLKYMFDKGFICTSISFVYNKDLMQYEPVLIYDYADYNICGSIYQEVKLIQFIRDNVDKIVGGFACFSLPCQTKAIRYIVEQSGHACMILGLTCSSQQSLEATHYLLKRINVNRSNVINIQYRGGGWPSGIQITQKKPHNSIFIPNNGSIWTQIFHSRMFIKKRCFHCLNTLNTFADITLADPWLKDYIRDESEGQTLLAINTKKGLECLLNARKDKYIIIKEVKDDLLFNSQSGSIRRKESYRTNPIMLKMMLKFINSSIYRRVILRSSLGFALHCKIKDKWEHIMIGK